MSSSSDFGLTRLFLPRPTGTLMASPVGGTMTAWDPVTYSNTVIICGVTYSNLDVINPTGLTVGPVLVQRTASGWIVVGMIAQVDGTTVDPLRWRSLPNDITTAVTALANAGNLNFLLNSYRRYAVDGVMFFNSSGTADLKFAWTGPTGMVTSRWGFYGTASATSGTSGNLQAEAFSVIGDANFQVMSGAAAESQCRPGGTFETGPNPGLLQLRWAQNTASGTSFLRAGSRLSCADMGLATGSQAVIKQYLITGSRSYDTDGTPIGVPDQDNNVYQGIFSSRSFGNERAMLVFPGSTIRSDLAGATLLTARLYLYCFQAGTTTGSFVGKTEPNSSVAATYDPGLGGAQVTMNYHWPVPGWASVSCYPFAQSILAGHNAVGMLERVVTDTASAFRGFGFGTATRPYLELTYIP